MTDEQFSVFLEWFMCSDPWPLLRGRDAMAELADAGARKRGYGDWVEAYRKLPSAANDR